MQFQSSIISNDGTSSLIMGNGDPNVNSVSSPTPCAVYLDSSSGLNVGTSAWNWTAESNSWTKNNG